MNSTSPLSRLNLPLLALWLASVVAAVAGWAMLRGGNAGQVELYTTQSGDYAVLFAAQSASTVGGLLIAVGVLGVLLALAVHAVARTRTVAATGAVASAAPAVIDDPVVVTVEDEPAIDDEVALDDTLDEPARVDGDTADVDLTEQSQR